MMGMVQEPTIMFCTILFAAIVLDLLIGDPRWFPHPVVLIGKLITYLEKSWNRGKGRVWKGICLCGTVILLVFFLTLSLVYLAYQLHPFAGIFIQIYLISTTIAIKGLSAAAKEVLVPIENGNITEARDKLSMIVGRDTEHLPENEIVRGTVETVAENTVDGITAPLFWAFIGGAPLVMVYRAINTLDSMVGHKNERFNQFGWASARLDDLVNWIPARLTALSMWLAAYFIKGSNYRNGWKTTWRDARKHPSPNSGWSEAMVAGLLGIQLGGINYYQGRKSVRAQMGAPLRKMVSSDIEKTIRYMHGGWIVFFICGVSLLLLVK